MKEKFLYIIDDYSKDTQIEPALIAFGLRAGEEYSLCPTENIHEQMFAGVPGERPVDAEILLVFISLFQSRREPAVHLARVIKLANPRARIFFRSSFEESELDPVFEGSLVKEHFRHPKITALIREIFGIE